ncbi:FMN-dependent NADH-azoreductase [Chryseobacterium ginsenosidimutans]|uniref:FMN-dependent NADH-azoreductase n=1 Tax=Chryseobacterium ginsenosidimutans TaxID=687846 RepID=UPI0027880C18|nr:NAD(P)H-dependent oxidoreductase [Chryseobacterium ginsenosidimutans]MDQ0594636.1 FMN-dependent NADH-azoreductase [Chryseobacterium ginsenosidimutans]
MANILNIQSSISGENSVSNKLSQAVINQLLKKNPDSKVVVRDLASNPIPHLEIHHFSAARIADEEKNDEQKEASKYSDESLQQIQEADIIVIGVPFYNFTFPSTLKSWIDSIAVAGKTFSYADGTPKGLLQNKKLYLNFAVGGVYENGLIENMEHYLKTLFAFMGITDVEVFQSQGLMVPQLKDENLAKTVAKIEELV